jgi:hypothetical protein
VTLDSIDLTLWLAGIAMETVLLGLVVWKRIYRTLPLFACFFVWCLLSDGGMAIASRYPNAYMAASVANISIDALFQLAILAELGKAVVRHNHGEPPSRIVIGLLAVLAVVLAGCINKWKIPTQYALLDTIYLVLMQIFAVLRVVFLLTLVWWSSLKGLRWPTRELRIVTGLGAYIIATLVVAILHSHDMVGMQYHWLDQVLVGIYLWTLAYWILASTTKVVNHQ